MIDQQPNTQTTVQQGRTIPIQERRVRDGSRHIQVGLVQAERLDERRTRLEDGHHLL
jgi:hypothetical protein